RLKLNGFSQPLKQAYGSAVRRQRREISVRRRRRAHAIFRLAAITDHERDKFRMERGFNLRDQTAGDGVEAGRRSDFVADAAQQALCVQALPKESAIQSVEPVVATDPRDEGKAREPEISPPARSQDTGEGNIAMDPEIREKDAGGCRKDRHEHAASQRILQAEADDQADVEQAMTQKRVSEGNRKRQRKQRAEGDDRR